MSAGSGRGRDVVQRIMVVLCLAGAAACGLWQRAGTEEPSPEDGGGTGSLTQMFDAREFYRRIGRLSAGPPLPFIGSVALVKGRGDSVLAVVGISLEDRALTFQRDAAGGYVARYRVDVAFTPATGRAIIGGQDETVRVESFAETQRADESVLFQKYFKIPPGSHKLAVTVRDAGNGNQSRAELALEVPSFGPGTTSAPVLAYQVRGRQSTAEPLQVVLNNRGTVAYGGDTLLAYVEAYDLPGPTTIPFRVTSELRDSTKYLDSLRFRGGLPVESQVIRLRPDSIALGQMELKVGSGPDTRTTTAVVSLSTAWLVTNFDEMLDMLRYFRAPDALLKVRRTSPEGRAEAWRQFWKETDPNPDTPENEALNAYFARVAIASQRFRDEGMPGWRTDRGEVFIRLGEPDEIFDASALSQQRVYRWSYIGMRLVIFFRDDSGFGRFRLTPDSRAEFERVAAREEQ
jgi:GWxTD domain-containing protein